MGSPAQGFVLFVTLRTFLGVGGRLPPVLTRPIGALLGRTALRLMPKTRRRVRSHIEIAFPELDDQQRNRLMAGSARHFGLMLAEVAWLWRALPEQVEAVCTITGLEHMSRAREEGRGVMFATAHCGNWEILSARLPVAGVPLISAVRELEDPRLDHLVTSTRTRFGTEIVPRGPAAGRQLARALGRNKVVGLLIDQDIRDVPGVFVPFFGRQAWTPSGAAMLAIRRGCPVVPGFIHRQPDGRHVAEIHPPLPMPSGGSLEDQVEELTAAATSLIEGQIRNHPEQWVWMHRRWRRRPESMDRSEV